MSDESRDTAQDQEKKEPPIFHHVKVPFDAEVFAEFFIQKGEAFSVSAGMPPGTVLVDIMYDFDMRQGVAVFWHESFEPHCLEEVPYVNVEWQKFGIVESKVKLVDSQGRPKRGRKHDA